MPLFYVAGGALAGFLVSDGADKVQKTILYGVLGLIAYKVIK